MYAMLNLSAKKIIICSLDLVFNSAQPLLNQYQRESDDSAGWNVAMKETWTRSYEPNLKRQSNE